MKKCLLITWTRSLRHVVGSFNIQDFMIDIPFIQNYINNRNIVPYGSTESF
jgi:hypothetical protein